MINAEIALMCARLYLRDGKSYLQQGSFSAGLEALYDAILFGMHYYIADPTCRRSLDINNDDLWDHAALYHKLTKAGLFDDLNAFNHLSQLVERALWQGSFSMDVNYVIREIETILSRLGILPFNESILNAESIAVC